MTKSGFIFGLTKNEFERKIYECIKKNNGASEGDILKSINIVMDKNNFQVISRYMNTITSLYKEEKNGLWYVCPWKKREVYNDR